MKSTKQLTIEGFTPEQILALSDEELNKLVFIDEPIVFKAGSAEIIGKFYLKPDTLVLELAQIDGGRSVVQLFKKFFFRCLIWGNTNHRANLQRACPQEYGARRRPLRDRRCI